MQGVYRGGTLTIATDAPIDQIGHPATLGNIPRANIIRQVAENLTLTNADNITTPHLLERWEANSDVSQWTLILRRGIKFNNGDELTADDLLFNFSQWLDPDLGSTMTSLLSYLDGMESVEKIDDYTIRLDLNSPNIGVPEHLFHYPALIMHRDFEGDFIAQPVGTGPFTLTEYVEGDRAICTRRDDYWQFGEDGLSLPYLDEVVFLSLDNDAAVNAMQTGEADSLTRPRSTDFQLLKDNPDIKIDPAFTASTVSLRVRVDEGPPWDDVRVRQALRKVQNRERILALAYFGQGDYGADAHVAPVHPAYHPRPIPEYDPEGAKALLDEWAADTGNSLPIRATIVTKNDAGEQEFAEVLQEDAAVAGFEFDLDITDASGYWDRWLDVSVGITQWTHRPLDTMLLSLVYTADENGVPVLWNESRWVDPEFIAILKEAEATLDVTLRRDKVEQLMNIFQERGPVGIPFYKNTWRIYNKRVRDFPAHPSDYDLLDRTWVDPTQEA